MPFVSIVIPVLNGEKYIGNCLDSLNKINYPKNRYEIIVIDGGSDDKTVEIIKKFDDVKLINSTRGTPHQRNVGIKEAKGELIAFTDADCIVDRDWLINGVKHFKDNQIALVGGPNCTPENSKFLEKSAGYLLSSRLATGPMSTRYAGKGVKEAVETDLIACNNIMRKDIILEVDGFNEDFFPAEENELYFRLKEKGYKLLFNSEMVVWHHRVPLYRPFAKQIYRYGQFRAKLLKTAPKIFRFLFLLPSLLILYLLFGGILASLILAEIVSFSKPTLFSNSTLSIDSILLYFYFSSIIFYYLIISIESLRISIKEKNAKLIFVLPLGFFLLHCSYGLGFLKGILKS
ncbi:MAG: glycosyltransferase [Candidatus Hodarchaeota archaeon]